MASISSGTHPCGEDNGILDSSQRRDLPQGKDFAQPFRVITAVSERRLIPFTKHYMLMDTSQRVAVQSRVIRYRLRGFIEIEYTYIRLQHAARTKREASLFVTGKHATEV